jgi:hypothetical protein
MAENFALIYRLLSPRPAPAAVALLGPGLEKWLDAMGERAATNEPAAPDASL